jgi:hypothetical protein
MKACATAGGGVMFIPDELERKSAAISYDALVKPEKNKIASPKTFGKRRRTKDEGNRVAA